MRQRRPSLSTIPYPVGPVAAGSKPRTRIHPFFWFCRPDGIVPVIVPSLRPSVHPCQRFVEGVSARNAIDQKKTASPDRGLAAKQTKERISSRQRPPGFPIRRCRNWHRRVARRRVLRELPPAEPSAWLARRSA